MALVKGNLHEESLPFLDEEKQTSQDKVIGNHKRASLSKFTLFNGVFLIANVAISLLILSHVWPLSSSPRRVVYSPAQEAIEYEAKPAEGLINGTSVFVGYPSPQSDLAWSGLLEANIRISKDEMRRLDTTSLPFQDGDGYLGMLGVYHQLHCLKQLRKWIYRDYYYRDESQSVLDERAFHADHCVEYLRQIIMCHGDTTVNPFRWLHDDSVLHRSGPTLKEGAQYECVNWDMLSEWAKSRRVDLKQPDLLVPET
ncbi:hypothetical protein F4821DRAFT_221079 [Hypoxylon rubiginosum]|uniref:Uncharacterized protein n=1 Tax=Hypoxylon rubiginosum TaxID=110542 RepID=A0ACC0DM14_9PEZI|nr:hypothetical protein F4821DRAFT_221079 [Hypoxylon rubiginosum]